MPVYNVILFVLKSQHVFLTLLSLCYCCWIMSLSADDLLVLLNVSCTIGLIGLKFQTWKPETRKLLNISLSCINSEIYILLKFLAEINTAGKYITDAPMCLEMNTLWTKNHIYSHHNNSLFWSPALSGCTCGLFIWLEHGKMPGSIQAVDSCSLVWVFLLVIPQMFFVYSLYV